MARKNLIGISDDKPHEEAAQQLRDTRPLAGFVPQTRAPVGTISKTLGAITEKVERAEALEKQLAMGETIVELDPTMIDASFVKDRLAIEALDLQGLVEQMRDHGQQVPVLVRPHPEQQGRYQLAYGHRRVAASKMLERKVKAVIRDLTDEQLVVSQGQENNSRADLSYIERCLFAARLEDGGFSRDIITASLGVDKTNISRMIALVRDIPTEIILAIGAAPAIGRRRWAELVEKLPAGNFSNEAVSFLQEEAVRSLNSDERFEAVFARLNAKETRETVAWQRFDDATPVKFQRSGTKSTFVFSDKEAPGFDEFVKSKLSALYAEYLEGIGE